MAYQNKISTSLSAKYRSFHLLDQLLGREKGKAFTKNSRRRFYNSLQSFLAEKGQGQVIPLERRKNLSDEEFKNKYVKHGIPVVLEGAASDWDCVKKWSLDYFQDLHGNDEVLLADQIKIENDYEVITLNEIIEGIKQGNGKYYRFYPLLERHPEHLADFDYKWLRSKRNSNSYIEAFQVFIGGDKTITPIHNANLCNLFTQVVGEKKWVLYHPEFTPIIDPHPVKGQYRNAPYKRDSGPFNPFNPDFNDPYSLFKYIDGYSVQLNPGDVLWNPPYHWHAVENIGNSIGVGYRWFSPSYCYKLHPYYSFLDTIATNPTIWKFLNIIKKDGNLIYLMETGKLQEYLKSKKKIK